MGIKGLSRLIADVAPDAIREKEIDSYFKRKVAIDASMSIYQFMIAIRTGPSTNSAGGVLTNENGETTSHLQGMFYRTIRMLSHGIKPAFVFDGKPPEMKGGELEKRAERRAEANEALKEAKAAEDHAEIHKFSRRTVRVGRQENDECKKLLQLLGVPVVEAPCEAEAQCAALCRAGLVFGTATEDMDALTFGTPVLLRHLTVSAAKKLKIAEFHLDEVLKGLELSFEQFRDLCILCGCDYLTPIKGIGPKSALKFIQQHKTLEQVIENLNKERFRIPENYDIPRARKLFSEPDVADPSSMKLIWKDADEDGIIKFLVDDKGFNLERVKGSLKKLKDAKKKGSQSRLEDFFGASTVIKRKAPSKPVKKSKKVKRVLKRK